MSVHRQIHAHPVLFSSESSPDGTPVYFYAHTDALPSLIYSGYYRRMYKPSSVLLLRKCLLCHLRTLHSGTSHRVMPEADGSDARSQVHCMQEFSSLHRILFQPPVPYLLPYMIWIHPLTPLQLFHMLLLHLP